MRIQKYLSKTGVCSRRKAEVYIKARQVKINGIVAKIGQSIEEGKDKIELGEKLIKEQRKLVYYKINKPRGIITTCAEYSETNIIDIIKIKERVFPIGRLDKESTGLLLLTNDGRLTNYLTHPKYNHKKEYVVEVFGSIKDAQIKRLSEPMYILGSKIKKVDIKRISSSKFYIILTEGKNRQIRRMVEKVGAKVKKLKRIRIENIKLGDLKPGEYIKLTKKEKQELFSRIGLINTF